METVQAPARGRDAAREYTRRNDCRLCGGAELARVWSFGETPLANSYVKPGAEQAAEITAPLEVHFCEECALMQLRDVVHPDLLFRHYLYVSSTSSTFVRHFEEYARELVEKFQLDASSMVVDIGSNDGVLLKPLQKAGVSVLGVDPAENVAEAARADGVPTVADYFVPETAERVREAQGQADVIAANNVFAHTDHIDAFVEAVDILLADDGVFVFEVQYLGDLVAKNLFDIVYHEHANYYHLTPLDQYFRGRDMEVFDVERLPVHGGSLRVYVQKAAGRRDREQRMEALLAEEAEAGLNSVEVYQEFARRVEQNGAKLRSMIEEAKQRGERIVGYGAPAKATTLCYAFGLTADDIEFIVDDAPLKQGMLMPGTHIPIRPPEALYEERPDVCVILAWNFAEPIAANHAAFTERGGKFLLPVPDPNYL